MGIDTIVQQQAQSGDLDSDLAVDLGYGGGRPQQQGQSPDQSRGRMMTDGGTGRYQSVQVPNDVEFWLDVAKVALLFIIALKL